MLKLENIALIICMILAVSIFGWRMEREQDFSPLYIEDGAPYVDKEFFEEKIQPFYPRFNNSLTQMIVIIGDTAFACPDQFPAGSELTEPFKDFEAGIYDLTIFLPDDTGEEMVQSILNVLGVQSENIIFYDRLSPISTYKSMGVTMLFYAYGKGLMWSRIVPDGKERLVDKIYNSIQSCRTDNQVIL